MPTIQLPGGGTAIVCTRGRRPILCTVCRRSGDLLCDGKRTTGKRNTCDAGLCRSCAVRRGPKDFCPKCADQAPAEQLGLGL